MGQTTIHAMGEQHLVHRTGWLRALAMGVTALIGTLTGTIV